MGKIVYPKKCPKCGSKLFIKNHKLSEYLNKAMCPNKYCSYSETMVISKEEN